MRAIYVVLTWCLAGCGQGRSCLTDADINPRLIQGAALEREGRLQEAYRQYDVLESSCADATLSGVAFENSLRLHSIILKAYKEADSALKQYATKHQHYPDSLDDIRSEITAGSLPAFSGFGYVKDIGGIVTGLYGSVTFDLHNR